MSSSSGNHPLLAACETGRCDLVKALLEGGTRADTPISSGNKTALMYASTNAQRLDVLQLLLDYGAAINAVDEDGWSPLMFAAFEGQAEIVRVLVENGAQKEASSYEKGWTPLMRAVIMQHEEVVETLLDCGAFVNAVDDEGWTSLMHASENDDTHVVMALLRRGALLNTKSQDNETPLAAASLAGAHETTRVLLESGAVADARDNTGATPIMSGSSFRYGISHSVVTCLLAHNASIDVADVDGGTVLLNVSRNSDAPAELAHDILTCSVATLLGLIR